MLSNDVSELLTVSDAVAREKGISRDIVVDVVREAIAKVAHARYGSESDLRVELKAGDHSVRIYKVMTAVEEVEFVDREITLDEARLSDPHAIIGTEIIEELPAVEFGRVAINGAKQVVVQRVRDAERDKQYEEYKDRVGEIVYGIVQRVEYGNVIVDVGRGEGILKYRDLIPGEKYQYRDRVRAVIQDVRRELRGPQIFLSRTKPEFMVKLFTQEVPEIYDGVVEIKSCARDPGGRAKIAVISNDESIDPVGACVGMRGSRVQAVVGELQGERVDIINWSPDPATFVVNAMAPAEVAKVIVEEDHGRMDVVVRDDQQSLAIGRRGQNVRLAAELTGWELDIMTEAQSSDARQAEFNERTELFVRAMNVDEVLGQLLAAEGFGSVEEIANCDVEDFAEIEGFDDETSLELIERAAAWVEEERERQLAECEKLGVDQGLIDFGLPLNWVLKLAANDILTIEDFAGSVPDDLVGWTERDKKAKTSVTHEGIFTKREINRKQAETFITLARVELGWIPEPEVPDVEELQTEDDDEEQGEGNALEVNEVQNQQESVSEPASGDAAVEDVDQNQ